MPARLSCWSSPDPRKVALLTLSFPHPLTSRLERLGSLVNWAPVRTCKWRIVKSSVAGSVTWPQK